MSTLRMRTAGESHGPCLTTLIEGMPAGVTVDIDFINGELARRQQGYGRGARQRIESDRVQVTAGVRRGLTTGAPIVLSIPNKDSRLDDAEKTPPVHRPRPGHADLAGCMKWLTDDCRNTLERASARETAARVAGCALARCLLREFEIEAFGFVRGAIDAWSRVEVTRQNWESLRAARDASEIACPDAITGAEIIERIRAAKVEKDTVGGLCEVHVFGVPPGLGTCVASDERLDARIAGAVMGIQAFKSVEIGMGRTVTERFGSQVHDPIHLDRARTHECHLGFTRPTNNAGGIEGGMTNGMPVVVKGGMKPISTLLRGLPSVDLTTGKDERSDYERSDISAVAAASVVMENVVAFEIARVFLEKHGGDTMDEVHAHFDFWRGLAMPRSAT
ncbi:MAG: chorismate synthase [Planctomycetota bacterium]|nr:chorismate synthase [Planctomycetota bacterium]MDA1106378.1 chorismate synthase [Planctomycetota bacterium]